MSLSEGWVIPEGYVIPEGQAIPKDAYPELTPVYKDAPKLPDLYKEKFGVRKMVMQNISAYLSTCKTKIKHPLEGAALDNAQQLLRWCYRYDKEMGNSNIPSANDALAELNKCLDEAELVAFRFASTHNLLNDRATDYVLRNGVRMIVISFVSLIKEHDPRLFREVKAYDEDNHYTIYNRARLYSEPGILAMTTIYEP